jgi:hypothetical protein
MRLPLLLLAAGCSDYDVTKVEEPVDDPVPDTAPVDTAVDSAIVEDPTCAGFLGPDAPSVPVDPACLNEPVPGTFDPVVEWTTEGTIEFASEPAYKHPYVMPAVANLTDDNGDGVIDTNDIPDIAYTMFSSTTTDTSLPGYLRVVSGDGTAEVMSVSGFTVDSVAYAVSNRGGVAIGDLEGDGRPDLVTITNTGGIVAFEADGTPKWVYTGTATSVYSYPSLADLDGDGLVEVVVGQIVLGSDGAERWIGGGGLGRPDSNSGWGSISVPVDVDGDGALEIAAGNTLYDTDGSILAQSGLPDGFSAIGDIDGDGGPDIVTTVHSVGEVYVWKPDGTLIWSVSTGAGGGGPPTVADFDGDGAAEIGVAGRTAYTVLDTDGSVLWSATIQDYSSSATGSSVFDFDADGAAEVVFADEVALYIFDGATGATRWQNDGHMHGTAWEYPVIADVDHDDQAEIIVASTNNGSGSGWNGITVIGDANLSWAPARPIWNQHAYHITNIEGDGGVPAVQAPNWSTWNNFRAGGTELGPSHWLADLVPAAPDVCVETCALGRVELWLPVANAGLVDAGAFDVSFVREDGVVVHTERATGVATGSGAVLGPIVLERVEWGAGVLTATLDAAGEVAECVEDDNVVTLGAWPCP